MPNNINKLYQIIIIFGFFLSFQMIAQASGDIRITEIMYDPLGTDSGREWVEVYFPGDPSGITEYYLRENEVNHTVREYEDHTVRSESEYIIIADNPPKFLIDFPDYEGYLFDSAFSLKNTGELLQLVDDNQDVVFSYEYAPYEEKYDSMVSLHMIEEGAWSPGEASPGSGEHAEVKSATAGSGTGEASSSQSQISKQSRKKKTSTLDRSETFKDIKTHNEIVALAGVKVTFEVYEKTSLKQSKHKMRWSYGDGSSDQTSRATHVYQHPGEYIATASYQDSQGDQETKLHYVLVTVLESPFLLVDALEEGQDFVEVENISTDIMNIEGFRLVFDSGYEYRFPRNTLIHGKGSIKIPRETILKFNTIHNYNNTDSVRLEYPQRAK